MVLKKIIKKWIDKCYIPYFKQYTLYLKLYWLDLATIHDSFEIQKYLSDNNINIVFIYKRLTGIL